MAKAPEPKKIETKAKYKMYFTNIHIFGLGKKKENESIHISHSSLLPLLWFSAVDINFVIETFLWIL